MQTISNDNARDTYGITSEHNQMDNDELRFRLKKSDGTAYIRTESPAARSTDSGWQQAHWHDNVKETYIVQSEWMVYATYIDKRPKYYRYNAGELFTVPPDVIHNVYLPSGAVIHTVKHGGADAKRLTNELTEQFTNITKPLHGDALAALAVCPSTEDSSGPYNSAYCHFDNLIWQVPAWSTAIFAVVLTGMARVADASALVKFIGVSVETFLAISCGMVGVFIGVLSYALYRFRWHQIGNKWYTPALYFSSPQFYLQGLVNVQVFTLLFLSLKGLKGLEGLEGLEGLKGFAARLASLVQDLGVEASCVLLGVLIIIVVTVGEERGLTKKGRGKPIESKS